MHLYIEFIKWIINIVSMDDLQFLNFMMKKINISSAETVLQIFDVFSWVSNMWHKSHPRHRAVALSRGPGQS